MMRENLLIDPLPESVAIFGREVPIHSDFRTGILFELMMADPALSKEEKLAQMLLLFFDEIPQEVEEAVHACLTFYRCGKSESPKKEGGKVPARPKPKQIYDFDYDDGYIYAAFLDQYGIDLNQIDFLHWWKFRALLTGLKEDNEIVKIMGYRAADLSKIKDKNERSRISRLKAVYALPSNLTFEEKVAAAGALFGGACNR